MKQMTAIAITVLAIIFAGCDVLIVDNRPYYDDCSSCWCDNTPPPIPRNVRSVTGDNSVYIYWNPVSCWDLDGYDVFRGNGPTGYYDYLGSTRSASFTDWTAVNGRTYYYAISSYDYCGNVSELSTDMVYDTPRPEGYSYFLWSAEIYPNDAGYDLSHYSAVPYDYPTCDFYFGHDALGYYLNVGNDYTDIMEWGYALSLSDVDFAPSTGWSPYADVVARPGYAYIIWTADNHFATVLVREITGERLRFDWAYQTVPGNPELKAAMEKPSSMIGNKIRQEGESR